MIDAMFYYEHQAEGLGSDFIDRIGEAVSPIEKNPEAYPKISNDVRRCLVRQFPFALLYKVGSNELLILAVMHLKRKPSYWIGR